MPNRLPTHHSRWTPLMTLATLAVAALAGLATRWFVGRVGQGVGDYEGLHLER
ncbi:MAG TPA: hypothetical protein VFR90_03065 [Methylibium sp.]|uniref:hypothetical protein n=1 Tax=Methylibium sp. TaxID=2067992 RepID=UPI002DBF44F8|nr:hypothetical protein [Methylibium sp.]HEU4458082.1 hypothetical protein [Methylibium sp.]